MADSDAATRAAAFDLIEKMVREEFVPPHNNNRRIETLSAELSRLTTLRPLSELTAEDGEVLLWLLGSDGEVHCRGLARFDSAVVASRASEVYRWSPLPRVRKPDNGGGT